MTARALALAAAVAAALLWVAAGVSSPAAGAAEEQAAAFASGAEAVGWTAPAQGGDEEANPDRDDRVPVQIWTVFAAGGAAGVGLVVYLLRVAMGWVKPPPPPEERGH